ncbi:hypothetical protein PC9H_008901 [Pleurotus ostreatus]|uniref:Integrase core domain-containing protein n=1 Tax=Pleurotus ostreatus TaxID=5322 RepID=A0A8H6ZS10_PLEOS|nr:uncharacterized protein PC9H_008901 [Pleurotus ostreatus]KAF7426532.1 hypothetical protein PC9H_008901 [Pleurotus ostreatus]
MLPPIPARPTGDAWPFSLLQAYEQIDNVCSAASHMLRQEAEANRLRYHAETLITEAVPLLLVIEENSEQEGIPSSWLHALTTAVGVLIAELEQAYKTASKHEDSNVFIPQPVTLLPSGDNTTGGRPRKEIDPDFLRNALQGGRTISIAKLARLLGVSHQTLYSRLHEYGIDHQFSQLTNNELDNLVHQFREARPASGLRYLPGFLAEQGLRVQRQRTLDALRRVDGIGQKVRQQTSIQRRSYQVSRPNALWHVDGHHKLIHWGIVIMGFVDGYSQTVVGLRASDNNQADTALEVFIQAMGKYGQPSRVPTVALSYGEYQHAIHGQNDLHLMGRLEHGEYHDDCAGVTPEEMTSAYGVEVPDGDTLAAPATYNTGEEEEEEEEEDLAGAGDGEEDEEDMWREFEEILGQEYAANFLPKRVEPPKAISPFTQPGDAIFAETLARVHEAAFLPGGFSIRPTEWAANGYPAFEMLRVGKRTTKQTRVALPPSIWQRKAELWVQGLHTMQTMMYSLDN